MKTIKLICLAGLFSLNISCVQKGNVDNSQTNTVKADSSTLSYFKEIVRQQKVIRSNDAQMLSITDSLFSGVEINQGFYFLVFTKSMNCADGFYSEAVGNAALEYLTTRTNQFIQNFRSIHDLNDLDLYNWADYTFREIQVDNEGREIDQINKLEKLLLEKIDPNRNVKAIELLIERMKSTSHNIMYAPCASLRI